MRGAWMSWRQVKWPPFPLEAPRSLHWSSIWSFKTKGKRRLGQYAVVRSDDRPVLVRADAPLGSCVPRKGLLGILLTQGTE